MILHSTLNTDCFVVRYSACFHGLVLILIITSSCIQFASVEYSIYFKNDHKYLKKKKIRVS